MLPGAIPSLGLSVARSGGAAAYQISRSIRLRGNANQYFERKNPTAGDVKKWTWAGWVKRAEFSRNQVIFEAWSANTDTGYMSLVFLASDQLALSGWSPYWRVSSQVFRDASAWTFILCALDAANSTCRIEINGVPITAWATNNTIPNQSYPINGSTWHEIGAEYNSSTSYRYFFNGYMAECNFVSDQYLDSTSFGSFDLVTGVWTPKKYTGSYGVNGFYLDYADYTTLAALGLDRSGMGNNFTTGSAFSVTPGANLDSLVDTPAGYGNDTGVGNEVRGNYCMLNPTDSSPPSQAIIYHSAMSFQGQNSAQWGMARATMWVNTGKWYWEVATGNLAAGVNGLMIGVMGPYFTAAGDTTGASIGNPPDGYGYYSNGGNKFNNGGSAAYGASYAGGDVVGVALDLIAGTLTFYKNGVSQGAAYSGLNGYFAPAINSYNLAIAYFNFGQKPFTYPAPAGFKCLCTQNFPDPAIKLPKQYMNAMPYIGNGVVRPVNGVGHQPDLVWMKSRTSAYNNILIDSARGTAPYLLSESNSAEGATTTNVNLTSFDADGFTLGATSSTNVINASGDSLIGWTWKKGALPGLDILTFTANASGNQNVPHALGVMPAMYIAKCRSATGSWVVWHKALGSPTADYLLLEQAVVKQTVAGIWGTGPTTSTLGFLAGNSLIGSAPHVAYAFSEVPGFSFFGKYTGNGLADGAFVWCGFKPRFIMLKCFSGAENWITIDTARDTYNVGGKYLYPSLVNAEGASSTIDFLSNGFKLRSTVFGNTASASYVFAAFAEVPTKYARAETRPNPGPVPDLEYLVVGGGGGGGGGASGMTGGGGGAGGMLTGTITKGLATYTIYVGNGGYYGTTGTQDGGGGGNSAIVGPTAIQANGGGNGSCAYSAPSNPGGAGGCGGGPGWGVPPGGPGAGTNGQGWDGAASPGGGLGGAGGGAGSAGSGSTGGAGRSSSISGAAVTYAIGGYSNGRYGNGVQPSIPTNYGGGADGGWGEPYGGQGMNGIVILRYLGPQRAIGGTITSFSGYTIHTFTGNGTLTFTG